MPAWLDNRNRKDYNFLSTLKWAIGRAQGPRTTKEESNNMPTRAKVSGKDYGLEVTSAGFVLDDLTAANFDAQLTKFDGVQTAFDNVSLITFDGENYAALLSPAVSVPVVTEAQREIKWRIDVKDATGDVLGDWSVEVGGADTSLLVLNSDDLDLTAGAGLALKVAIEANCVSRTGNAVTLESAKLVGRNT